MFHCKYMKELACFAGGVLFGTAGIKILSSKDAKSVYVKTTAAALRARSCVMDVVGKVQENAADVLAEAEAVNARRAADEQACEMECVQDEDASEA